MSRAPIGVAWQTLLAQSLLLATAAAYAEPLAMRDLNPLLSGYELPPALPSAVNGMVLDASMAVSNTSLEQHASAASLLLDAELQRWQFSFTTPLRDTLSMRIELPYVRLSGGGLDGFIESWHRTFGLPNGNRAQWPRNRLLISHSDTNLIYQRQQAAQGIGDLSLRLGQQLGQDESHQYMLWLTVKLPSGDAGKLTGSGATDVALSLSSSQQLSARFSSYQQVSLSWLGQGARGEQHSIAWQGSLGMEGRLSQAWRVGAQLDAHSRVLDSEIKTLGNALQLSFGPRYASHYWQADLLISEDIAVDTAPDVQLQFDLRRKF